MSVEFGRMTVLVDDPDEALEYYTGAFSLEVLVDTELEDGFRALHLGFPEQDGVGLWLVEAQGESERDLIGGQTGAQPSFVFYTDDLVETHATLADRGVAFTSDLEFDSTSAYVHFEDLYGNHGILVELDESTA